MITLPDTTIIGGTSQQGILIPGAIVIGGQDKNTPADTIFIQNDSNKSPTSPWYVTQVDATHYTMLNATPKNWQYLGAFVIDGATGEQIGRADGAVWTISNPSMVQHISTSSAGQAAVSILTAGTCTLTVALRDMVSTLVITAV